MQVLDFANYAQSVAEIAPQILHVTFAGQTNFYTIAQQNLAHALLVLSMPQQMIVTYVEQDFTILMVLVSHAEYKIVMFAAIQPNVLTVQLILQELQMQHIVAVAVH